MADPADLLPVGYPPLLARLVDDAGLFPPTQLPMAAALARHRDDERAGHPMLTHRFLVPASRLGEFSGELRPDDQVRVGLILDGDTEGWAAAVETLEADERTLLSVVEVPLPAGRPQDEAAKEALEILRQVAPSTPAFLEPVRQPGWLDAVGVLAADAGGDAEGSAAGGAWRGLKVRCGGARAELFPTPAELTAFFCVCAGAGVSCKASAGLHRAVRHRDERTGFDHFGYVNLLVAAARAGGGEADPVEAALASTDGAALVAEARSLSEDEALAARALFMSYGSCDTREPVAEASRLGLLPAG